jgi:hypothetical protein
VRVAGGDPAWSHRIRTDIDVQEVPLFGNGGIRPCAGGR